MLLKNEVSGFSDTLTISTRPHDVSFLKIIHSFVTSIKTSNLKPYKQNIALISIRSILLNPLLKRGRRKPGRMHEISIKMDHRELYCDVIKWSENEGSLMSLIELVTTGY
jgi:hypothetical protein